MASNHTVTILVMILLAGELMSQESIWAQDNLYLQTLYPELAEKYCANLPYYGGLKALLGDKAYKCVVYTMEDNTVEKILNDGEDEFYKGGDYNPIDESVNLPIVIAWNQRSMTRDGYVHKCKNTQCYFTENRSYLKSSLPKAIMFYGTKFRLTDLPTPRQPEHIWVLQHEESPKNQPLFSFKEVMELFNVTGTFRSESHVPIGTHYLRSIEQLQSTEYMKSLQDKNRYQSEEGLAPIAYVQSDCNVPSDRDKLISWMMKYIKIDSYGLCVHNKDLPRHLVNPVGGMSHADFIELMSKYKFVIAMENAQCKDYVTEKFWRPLYVGSIPIVLGAENIQESYAPAEKSIIHLKDFNSIKELVDLINKLNSDDTAYDEYRLWKTTGVTNKDLLEVMKHRPWDTDFDIDINLQNYKGNYIEHLECLICDRLHGKLDEKSAKNLKRPVTQEHYGCPLPTEFIDENNLQLKKPASFEHWHSVWVNNWCNMRDFLKFTDNQQRNVTAKQMTTSLTSCIVKEEWNEANLSYAP